MQNQNTQSILLTRNSVYAMDPKSHINIIVNKGNLVNKIPSPNMGKYVAIKKRRVVINSSPAFLIIFKHYSRTRLRTL